MERGLRPQVRRGPSGPAGVSTEGRGRVRSARREMPASEPLQRAEGLVPRRAPCSARGRCTWHGPPGEGAERCEFRQQSGRVGTKSAAHMGKGPLTSASLTRALMSRDNGPRLRHQPASALMWCDGGWSPRGRCPVRELSRLREPSTCPRVAGRGHSFPLSKSVRRCGRSAVFRQK